MLRAILAAYLLVWIPLRFANELVATVPSLDMRGVPAILELAAHGIVALVSSAAGWMLWVRSPAGPGLASVAVIASGIVSIQSLFWTVLPRGTAPGEQLPLTALAVVVSLFWLAVIRRIGRHGGG